MAPFASARAANFPRGLEDDTGGGDKPPDKPTLMAARNLKRKNDYEPQVHVRRSSRNERGSMYQSFHNALVMWKSNSGTLLIASRSQTTARALNPPAVVDSSLPVTPSGVRTRAFADWARVNRELISLQQSQQRTPQGLQQDQQLLQRQSLVVTWTMVSAALATKKED
ncbi:hypothetical protein N7488_012413 [Penicillium malachiteum]|nr:hypothetical protein N7488_012413 [Penicillium malachiteum]